MEGGLGLGGFLVLVDAGFWGGIEVFWGFVDFFLKEIPSVTCCTRGSPIRAQYLKKVKSFQLSLLLVFPVALYRV